MFDIRASLNLAQAAQAMLDDPDLSADERAELRTMIRKHVDRARQIADEYDAAFRTARAQHPPVPADLPFTLPSRRSKPE
jgi:hypothetical protein